MLSCHPFALHRFSSVVSQQVCQSSQHSTRHPFRRHRVHVGFQQNGLVALPDDADKHIVPPIGDRLSLHFQACLAGVGF